MIVTGFDIRAQKRQLAMIVGVRKQTNENVNIYRSDRVMKVLWWNNGGCHGPWPMHRPMPMPSLCQCRATPPNP